MLILLDIIEGLNMKGGDGLFVKQRHNCNSKHKAGYRPESRPYFE